VGDDFELLDDWSETEDWDASDAWDEADEHFGYGGPAAGLADERNDEDEPDDDQDHEGEQGWHATPTRSGAAGSPPSAQEGSSMGMSPWQFGTATAVAGWLLDRQADRIVDALNRQADAAARQADAAGRQADAEGGTRPPPGAAPAAPAAAWRQLTGPPLDAGAQPLAPGDLLERSRLAATIYQRVVEGRQLGLDAGARPGCRSPDAALDPAQATFTIVVHDLTPSAPVWVMFEERVGGFSAARLLPVFDGTGPPGRAYCFVDSGTAAVRVIEWGLERYGLQVSDFRWAGGF
jgi:hypothetical protein